MATKKLQEYFPKLNLPALQRYALEWAALFRDIKKICLFNGFSDDDLFYVIVVYVPPFNSNEDSDLTDYYNWRDPSCIHIQNILPKCYIGNPPESFIDEWFWYDIEPDEDISKYQIESIEKIKAKESWGPMVHRDTCVVLWSAEPSIDDLIIDLGNKAEKLYNDMTKRLKFSGKTLTNSTKDERLSAAVSAFDENPKAYHPLCKNHIKQPDIYEVDTKHNRKIIGTIIQQGLGDHKMNSEDQVQNYQILFSRYAKLRKMRPD